jgi:heat shock protein HtpX
MTTYDLITSNKRKTTILIMLVSAIVLGIGYVVDQVYDAGGAIFAIAIAYTLISTLMSYYAGDKVALASSGAREVSAAQSPQLVRMVENLCITAGMPMPKVHIIEDSAINAFATGRDPQHASIAVTTGALQKLENEELEGVLAHELSHIQNYDIRVMTVVIVLVGIISIVADFAVHGSLFGRRDSEREGSSGALAILGIVLIIFSPIIAELIKLAVSRRREYLADASGALMTRFPEGLARALRKIANDNQPMENAHTATAHLFISNPFGAGGKFRELLSTHPPIEKRIAALEAMGNVK